MGKAAQYLFILITIYGFLLLAGLLQGGILSIILNPESIRTSPLWIAITTALTLFGAVSFITLGIFPATKLDQGVSIGVTLLIADMIFESSLGIFNALHNVDPALSILLCSPIIVVGALSIFEWWRTPMV